MTLCQETGKRRYGSRIGAMLALAECRHTAGCRTERRLYRCPLCGGWHLTKQARGGKEW